MAKKQQQPTHADQKRQQLTWKWMEDSETLCKAVRTCFIRQQAASLYPEGPDKEAAQNDLRKAQHDLLCAIGSVDGTTRELNEYEEKHAGEFAFQTAIKRANRMSSHEIIEQELRKIYSMQAEY